MSDDWTRSGWERVLDAADRLRPRGRLLARRGLESLFPPEVTADVRGGGHPIAMEQLWHGNRLRLLELGLGVALLQPDDADVRRIRHPEQYQAAAAEIGVGLLLTLAGARLVRPHALERGKRVCEFVADFPEARFAVEVKLPDIGAGDRDLQVAGQALLIESMRALGLVRPHLPWGRATFHFAAAIARVGGVAGVDRHELEQAVREIDRRVRAAWLGGRIYGETDIGLAGMLSIHDARDKRYGMPTLQYDALFPRNDPGDVLRRVRRSALNKAAQQIDDSGLPGVIFIDVQRDSSFRNGVERLPKWASSKPNVAAVIVLDRWMIGQRLYGTADLVPGPRYREVEAALRRCFAVCDGGHLHHRTLCTVPQPCPLLAVLAA